MNAIRVNDSEVVREITAIRVNDSGTVREIQEIRVNDGGVIRSVFSSGPEFAITWSGSEVGQLCVNVLAYVNVTFVNTGNITGSGCDNNPANALEWLETVGTGNGNGYELSWENVSGDDPNTSPTLNEFAWHDLSSNITFSQFAEESELFSGVFTITIRETGNASTEETRNIELEAESTGEFEEP